MIDYATDSNTVAKTYTWGLDLSGDLQGAGGVGGLLAVTEYNATGNDTYYPSYDANGNVSEYVDDTDSVVAHYEYSPFGKITSSSGSKSSDFRHRYSTKYLDDETFLYYYGYRYYSKELGRLLSRDPIVESGFGLLRSDEIIASSPINFYTFCVNDAINSYEALGLSAKGKGLSDWLPKLKPSDAFQCLIKAGGESFWNSLHNFNKWGTKVRTCQDIAANCAKQSKKMDDLEMKTHHLTKSKFLLKYVRCLANKVTPGIKLPEVKTPAKLSIDAELRYVCMPGNEKVGWRVYGKVKIPSETGKQYKFRKRLDLGYCTGNAARLCCCDD